MTVWAQIPVLRSLIPDLPISLHGLLDTISRRPVRPQHRISNPITALQRIGNRLFSQNMNAGSENIADNIRMGIIGRRNDNGIESFRLYI